VNRFLTGAVALAIFLAGCSGGVFAPETTDIRDNNNDGSSHSCWGIWQSVINPAEGTLEFITLRGPDFHLNTMPFLEPPPLVNLTLESLKFNGNIIEADIGLRHPFLGLTEFTGFDVCGIFISNGSVTGYSDSKLRMAGEGDTRLLNPDGYSRWWNPTEFPVNNGTMFSYQDGLLGTPNSNAHYNSTLNGYKYFCDDLGAEDPISSIDTTHRGVFSAGKKNVRHYTIELGPDGLIFSYAVDANWHFPTGGKPWDVPDDFPPDANRSEAWRINITETENTLWNDGTGSGGDLKLQVDVYDWFNAGLNKVRVESPGNFDMVESSTPTGGGADYSTYEIEITDATPATDEIGLLISVVSEKADFEGFIPGTNATAYFTHSASVAEEPYNPPSPCKNIPLRDDAVPVDIALDHTNADLLVLYDDKTIYKYHKDDCYKTGTLYIDIPACGHLPRIMYALDMAPNRYLGIALTYVTDDTPGYFIYDADGGFNIYAGQSPPPGLRDSYTMTAGIYKNDMGFIRGYEWPGLLMTLALRLTKVGDWYAYGGEHMYLIEDGNTYGFDRVYYPYIKGAESDAYGNYIWTLEDPDYYASRWELVPSWLKYDNAYFGTGSQTDADDGWNDAKDITRDNQNRYFVLDQLFSGEPRVKMWTVDGNITKSIGGFGDSTTISGTPRRIEGSDFDGDIVVLHGDTPPYMVSVFNQYEMPGG